VPDAAGHVHVFAERGKTIHHFSVAPDGNVEHDVVESSKSEPAPASLSAAFDASGRLNLIYGAQHWVREDGGWHVGAPAQCSALVLAGSRFLCARQAKLTGTTNICTLFKPGTGCNPPRQIGIWREIANGAWSDPLLIDHRAADVNTLALDVDERGRGVLLYARTDSDGSEIRRLTIEPEAADSTSSAAPAGTDVTLGRTRPWGGACAGIDRTSGSMLVITSQALGDGKYGPLEARLFTPGEATPGQPIPVPEGIMCDKRQGLAAASGGRWLAVFLGKRGLSHTPIAYRTLSQGTWSEPVALGDWYTYSVLPQDQERVYGFPLIVNNGSGLALVVWSSDRKALGARWAQAAP
jgi:hypothetical protein